MLSACNSPNQKWMEMQYAQAVFPRCSACPEAIWETNTSKGLNENTKG